MTLSSLYRIGAGTIKAAAISIVGMAVTSCSSWIYEEPANCEVEYRLSFRFTRNMLDADAFGSQVTAVNLSVYDQNGSLVLHKAEQRAPTVENDYFMDIDLPAGKYAMLAWCEGESVTGEASSFSFSGHSHGENLEAACASLPLRELEEGLSHHHDINRLYYGLDMNVELPDTFGTVTLKPIYLTKDTNHLTIQLQNLGGHPLEADMVSFELEGNNCELDWQNIPSSKSPFLYRPWAIDCMFPQFVTGSGEGSDDSSTRAEENLSTGLRAEFTTGRIMTGKEQRLVIRRNDTGDEILSIPLVEYLLLVRNNYQNVHSDQEYLDRYDDFSMMFFIDEHFSWVKTRIIINGWRVTPPQHETL